MFLTVRHNRLIFSEKDMMKRTNRQNDKFIEIGNTRNFFSCYISMLDSYSSSENG